MLDQRLLRDNPELISQQLGRRGMEVDLTKLQLIAKQERDLEEQRRPACRRQPHRQRGMLISSALPR